MKRIDTNLSGLIISLVLIFLICFCTALYGQRQAYSSSEYIRNATVQMDKDGISPTFIKFQVGSQPTVFTFLNEYKKSFPAFNSADNELRLAQTFEDKLGEKHYRFEQYYKGIKVEEAQFILHENHGFVRAANGKLVHGLSINISPRLAESTALNNAVHNVGAEKYMWDSKSNEEFIKHEQKNSSATFYPHGQLELTCGKEELLSNNFKLVYRFDIYAEKPIGRYFVDVDAQNGEIINKIERIHHSDVAGSGVSLYNGTVSMTVDEVTPATLYRLQEHTTRSASLESYNMQNGTDYNLAVDFTAATADGTWDQTGVNVHWGAEATYDYYFNEHGRNSFDNAGGTIFSYAHFDVNYNNAFWDGTRMTYGDGDGVNFTPLVCLDVVGHEITHGVTQNSANLIYWGESGALNESFSDIFGNEVEFMKEGVPGVGTGSWRMGEDITPSESGIRNMQNPNDFNNADTYLGTYWVTTGSGDNGGVHYNSGVQNFWFYLLCEGGSGTNDHGNAYNVSAIGFTKAAAIAYRNLTVYLTPSSNYYAARVGAINSATDLYGPGSPEVQVVMDAWYAVGVYEPTPPSGILVWEGKLGGQDYSGSYINTFLTTAGFTTQYTNVFPPTLIGYDAVFLSYGNWSNQSTLFDDAMASVVKTYLEVGGKVYLEGGDALGYEQASNTALLNLFGLSSASDGTTNIIDGLAGQSGAITNGMLFTSSTQVSNTYIDIISPSTGAVSFIESSYGNVAVQNVGSYAQKTFCFSYALSQLVDGTSPSTRYDLLGEITNFLLTAVPSFVTLDKPIGGEIWKVGTTQKIKWYKYDIDNVKLEYTTDNGSTWLEIISSTPASSGEYEWTMPNTPSEQCKVKISDVLNSSTSDESDNTFTIRPLGPIAEQEPNNSANEAMIVGMFDEIEGTINPESDIDYFKFTGMAGDVVQIYGEERNGSGLYGLIMLFDQNGNQLYNNSYFMNTPTKQRIVYELPNNGIYYVRYSNTNNWGNYPNIIAKGNGHDTEKNRLAKLNKETSDVNVPFALSGEYRLTIGYFTPSAPVIGYVYATDVNYNSTRFSGQIYPNGLTTSVTIEYGLTSSYGNSFVAVTDANSLNEWYFTSDKLSGLQPNTFYHYRAVAQNSTGTTTGEDQTFSTPSEPVNWIHQNSNTTNSLRGVDFIDQNNGFVAGYGNTILKTTDGGTTWTNVCPQIGFDANCVEVINVNKIVAAGNSMLISEDGGSTWSQQQVGNYWLNGISFADVNNGIVVNANGEIYKTTDGGISWALLTDPISTSLLTVLMLDANTIFAVSSDGQVIKSTDVGLNWASQLLGNWCCSWWAGISFADMNNGMIASMNTFFIYKTTDGGNTWTTLNPPNNFPVVSMIDANNALAAGFSIIRTQNGGTTWTEEETGSANLLFGIKALSYGEVWAVGEWGTILHALPPNPLSGIYYIGATPGSRPGGGDPEFASLGAAFSVLNINGINGPCIFYFLDENYTEAENLALACNGTSATNTITFKPYTGVTPNIHFTQVGDNAGPSGRIIFGSNTIASFNMIAMDYVTFDGSNTEGGTTRDFSITENENGSPFPDFQFGIRIIGDVSHITIKNVKVTISEIDANSSYGILISPRNDGATDYIPDNIIIENCDVVITDGGACQGLGIRSSGTLLGPDYPTGIVFRNNKIIARTRGIFLGPGTGNTDIYGNEIYVNQTSTDWLSEGIFAYDIGLSSNTTNIYNNNIKQLSTANYSIGDKGIIGIWIGSKGTYNVYNNMIGGFATTTAVVDPNCVVEGIRVATWTENDIIANIYHNTVVIPDLSVVPGSGTVIPKAFYLDMSFNGTREAYLKNNILVSQEDDFTSYSIHWLSHENGSIFVSDYNNLSFTTNGKAGLLGVTDCNALTDWQTSATQDALSKSVSVTFVSATDIHLVGASLGDNNLIAVTGLGITTDIDGETRSSTYPYMGADENLENPLYPSTHFSLIWSGNPYTPMNIYVTAATKDGVDLAAGDEIGVFDGNNCVGFVKLTEPIPSGGYVQIIASTDDPTTPEVDGFIAGHTITSKLWDSNNSREITRVTATYALGDGTFSSLGSASVSLNGVFTITQNVELTTGWNIFSLTAIPDDPNMLQLLNSLISGGVLVKAQNEQGNAVEQLPVIGWINNIGDWLTTEGYYMKVNASSTLSVTGPPVTLPINIPLTNGWNILGYPVQGEQNALTVLDPLITANQLIKVQNEAGNAVEQLPIIGWINNIGNFRMDEGYYLKVNTNTSLNLDEPVAPITILAKTNEKVKQKNNVINKTTVNHFQPVYTSPYLPMNIYVTGAALLGGGNLGANDEIGIFDGSICVGAYVLTGPISTFISMIASTDDPTTTSIVDGFTQGHAISYRFWLSSISTEISDYTENYSSGDGNFSSLGTAVVSFTDILPVELTSFTANVNSNKVNLNWETATEVNNYGFEVERASSLTSLIQGWKKIGFVNGNGNSNSPKSYSYIDKNLLGGSKFQYRLKQIDADGKYTYSGVVEVEVVPTEYALYQNYPNPFNPITSIRFSLPVQSKVTLKVYDLIGNEITTLVNEEKPAGNFEVEFNTFSVSSGLSSGVYLYKLQAGDYVSTKKLILLK